MLLFNLNGKIIPPGRFKTTFGGDINGVNPHPLNTEIPTDGDYSGVTIEDTPGDPLFGQVLKRTTPGKAAVRGDSFLVNSNMNGFKLTAYIKGAGSGESSGQSNRSFRLGYYRPDLTQGIYLEYSNPSSGDGVVQLVAIKNGTVVKKPINFHLNNPGENYALTFYLTKNKTTGGWTVSCGEGDDIRTIVNFSTEELDIVNHYTKPHIEWEWVGPSGSFQATILHYSSSVYYRF